jgi:hypothetical protein
MPEAQRAAAAAARGAPGVAAIHGARGRIAQRAKCFTFNGQRFYE